MVQNKATCLYKEARLNIEPAYPGSTVSIVLPASSTSTFGLQTRSKHTVIDETYANQDDDAFAKRHLASDGSMYFRRHHKSPRSFLWRVLDNRKTLEIQATDLDDDFDTKDEASLTLLLHFTNPLRPFCIAIAEPEDRDALIVFAITNANELYTITLHRDFFVKTKASEKEVGEWCKRSSVNLLNTNIPYRLVTVSANELLVSLNTGGIVRLKRNSKDELAWTEALYQQNNWSIRGMLPWKGQQTVRFDDAELSVSSVAAMALSPDSKHIFSVSLDHRLKVYNVASGKLTLQRDLLHGQDDSLDRMPPYYIGPSQSTLMQIVNRSGGSGAADYHVVTYSPLQHQFIFWGVRDADDDSINGIFDAHSNIDLVLPIDELLDATVWTLEEFFIVPGPAGWRDTELWIRARSGPSSKVFSLKFDLEGRADRLAQTWRAEWTTVDSGPLTVEALKKNPANPGEQEHDPSDLYEISLTEQWLAFLFFPGRFTVATLETALVLLRRNLDPDRSSRTPRGSLKERLCATVGSLATKDSAMERESYELVIAEQWQAYYGLVKDFHKQRGEYISLTYDYELDMPWLVLSGHLSAIRKCSASEAIVMNAAAVSSTRQLSVPLRTPIPTQEARDVARLLNAAASFRRRLPNSFQEEVKRQVEIDLLQSRSMTLIDRMELMEEHSGLSNLLTEDDLASLVEELGTEVKYLSTDIFLDALQTLTIEEQGRHAKRKQIARYGLRALLRVSQETLDANQDTLLDLLTVILFMQFEEDLATDFDASNVFTEVINQFKDHLVLTWLTNTVWSHQTSTGPSSEALNLELGQIFNTKRLPVQQTVLEGTHGAAAFSVSMPSNAKSDLLTYWSRAWTASVFREENFDSVVEGTMGTLLAQREYELALDFSRFLTDSNWATYLKGRLHIALGENEAASVCFQKAAYNLALGMFNVEDSDNAVLVPETERMYFSEGLPRYYYHILSLFERAKAYSYAADFARLGLRTMIGTEDEEFRTELLQRLFTASLQTSRFKEAYTAMTRHSDIALKHSSLQALITSMVSQSQTATLLKFPFVGLADDVDEVLSNFCHKTLNLGSGPPYHQILYSFRISRGNFRGAASILHERLQRLKSTSSKVHDPSDESLTHCYLMIINALSSVGKDDAYLLAEQRIDDGAPPSWPIGKGRKMLKRHIVTLDTLRKEYQAELDRVAAIETGQFPFVEAGDEMDIL